MAETVLLIMLVCTGLCGALLWPDRSLNPLLLFILYSFLFYAGCLPHLDPRAEADRSHLFAIALYFAALLGYVVLLHDPARHRRAALSWRAQPLPPASQENSGRIWALLLLSLAISGIYFEVLVGYNLFAMALRGGVEDFTSLRLHSYGGEQYKGAGLVNQFKNTILPICFFLIVILARARGRGFAVLWTVALLPAVLWCLLGTGQRTFLVLSFAGLLLYCLAARRLPWTLLLAAGLGLLWLFSLYSVLLGRSEGQSLDEALRQLGWRLLAANQLGSVHGFRYIHALPLQEGAELMRTFLGYIPGVEGSDLANRVHAYVFGSRRGTIPLSFIGSLYHNFGLIGVPVSVILVLKFIDSCRLWMLRGPRSRSHLMIMAFLFLYLGIMPATTPSQILNNGLPGLVLLLIVLAPRPPSRTSIGEG